MTNYRIRLVVDNNPEMIHDDILIVPFHLLVNLIDDMVDGGLDKNPDIVAAINKGHLRDLHVESDRGYIELLGEC